MAENKGSARPQEKDQSKRQTGANTKVDVKATTSAKPETKAKADTKAKATTSAKPEAKATTKAKPPMDKNASTTTAKAGATSAIEERWTNVSTEDQKFLKKVGDKLSASTKRAKWIGRPGEHQDRKGQSLATRNHDVIRRWAEERQAEPATVPDTAHGDRLGVLRFNFPGYGGENLLSVSWAKWFKTFDERQLVFVYQENLKNGNQSNFFRFDNPYRENA